MSGTVNLGRVTPCKIGSQFSGEDRLVWHGCCSMWTPAIVSRRCDPKSRTRFTPLRQPSETSWKSDNRRLISELAAKNA